jgi:AAA15 family ATPase/GTPase
MLDSLYIGSYRGLREAELQNFADVNVFVGMNNAGKTSVLEAMILSGLFDDGDLLIQTLVSRYQQISIDLIKDMFADRKNPMICLKRQMRETNEIVHTHITYSEDNATILSEQKMNVQRELALKFDYKLQHDSETIETKLESGYVVKFREKNGIAAVHLVREKNNGFEAKLPCEFISFSRFDRTNYLIRSLDEILEQDKRAELIKVLQLFDPDVDNFEVIGSARNIKIFAKNREQSLSLYDYGNGMYKAFYIASAALLSENGILLVDEIEAGIHKEALRKFVRYLINLCASRKIQLFLTTHSLEMIDLILEYDKKWLSGIAAYNFRNDEGVTKVRRYSGEKLAELRNNMGLDIR